ncbi:MAG TPA: DNA sulfur modification protein DndB [Thermoanaerobaculia bacterium]|jgi:DNA sulfur modification protein DndB
MLNPTDGHIIAGVVLDGHRFSGKMRGAQLLQLAVDPRKTEDLSQVATSTELEALRKMRTEVQRLFEGAKAKNVEPYANYIVAVNTGQNGMTPPIILFTEHELPVHEKEDGTAFLQIPYGAQVVAIDGETQLAARFLAANINAGTKTEFVPVLVCHGRNTEWARQVFHDLNLLGVRPNAAVGISMDARDPLTFVARQVEQKVAFFKGRINTVRRQLRKSDPHVVTITGLRGACVTLAEGIGGVKYGARPVYISESEVPKIVDVATEWFTAVANVIGAAIEDRKRTVAGAPPVLAAIGAMGHELVKIDDADARAARREELLKKLSAVRWDKSKAWEGIAGKFSPKGNFSTGGSKETAYAVYSALTDGSSDGYNQIRMSVAA